MTISEFIAKWRQVELKERSAAQEHFLDLCAVFGHPTPAAADPTGESFCFEKGAAKHEGGDGFAGVWKRVFSFKRSRRRSPRMTTGPQLPPPRRNCTPSERPGSTRPNGRVRKSWNSPAPLAAPGTASSTVPRSSTGAFSESAPCAIRAWSPATPPAPPACAARLKDRTLTKLYNERPAWLAAYGWPADLTDHAILERLLDLNQATAQ